MDGTVSVIDRSCIRDDLHHREDNNDQLKEGTEIEARLIGSIRLVTINSPVYRTRTAGHSATYLEQPGSTIERLRLIRDTAYYGRRGD